MFRPQHDGSFRELSREEWLSMAMARHDPFQELRLAADATMMQGRRAKMEDKHALLKDLKDIGRRLGYSLDHLPSPTGMYMVYDGHQGVTCADYCIKQTHNKFMRKVFEDSFRELDEEFLAKYRTIPDGSTAVIALVIGIDLYVANIGDSACFLVQRIPVQTPAGIDHHQQQQQQGRHPNYKLEVKSCHTNHKPEDQAEKERIVKNGGAMVTPAGGVVRVAAADYEDKMKAYKKATNAGLGAVEKPPIALAVSRAFGDREFKTPNKLVVSEPSVNHYTLSPETDIALVLVCDGVTDVMTPAMIGAKILQYNRKPKAASGGLIQEAYQRGSQDNLTAITVFLNWPRPPTFGDLDLLAEQQAKALEDPSSPKAGKRQRTGPAREVKKIRCKHILMKHKDVRNPRDRVRNKQVTRTKTEAENTMMSILADLKKDSSKFPELCKKHSECLSSRKAGNLCGDLDWFGHGKMMAEFEEAAFALDVGEMSDLVYSPSGIHIIVRIA
ncbi:phosphatase, putative [Perkinsus marinus ATCC 50983]|uniref:Phosphatase, putative n=1 Tax=Perkinsus marinus (strain ATCC 50983 / TXsc) TaxID=423536 RepID=C5LB67_PERM5|nr:phosphatase, putative [Perkinsus marinus ATCC 50983]EER05995.1 phosphatase, putative [Perkinsus marinus ATCC 50983]|eukprot:XP_002774179.1 phosphatase, putative [Perkinsus marinus ATCC 50983]